MITLHTVEDHITFLIISPPHPPPPPQRQARAGVCVSVHRCSCVYVKVVFLLVITAL